MRAVNANSAQALPRLPLIHHQFCEKLLRINALKLFAPIKLTTTKTAV